MIVIAQAMWPPENSEQMGKAFLEVSPLPDYIKMTGPFVTHYVEKGIKAITIYEFDAANIEDANKAIGKRYISYSRVPGFTYEFRVWGDTEAALELLGLS
jgi:hypothetical protein